MKKPTKRPPATQRAHRKPPSVAQLDAMIQEATVDANDDSEVISGFCTMLEDNLAVPFKSEVLGVEVTVERIETTSDDQIVAVCARRRTRQPILLLDLPLPNPVPDGAEWIAALRRWARGAR